VIHREETEALTQICTEKRCGQDGEYSANEQHRHKQRDVKGQVQHFINDC
jgi:hypothetical protein